MSNIDEIESEIRATLRGTDNNLPRKIIQSPRFCLEDRAAGMVHPAVQFAGFLSELAGSTVRSVKWDNVPDPKENPRGTMGRFVIQLE